MADTTEKKTYLINVQDNLDVYAQRAADAATEVDRLTVENLKLTASGKATAAEIEKSNGALRNAQKEYTNAKKNVELATKANIANKNSYEELYRRWQLAQTQLKLMGDGYTTNTKGVRVLSTAYQQQSKVVADAKKSLDQFGKGVNDNRLNVGSYGEAIQQAFGGLSPRLASATSGMKQFLGTASKIGAVGGLVAGVIVALGAPLIAFFTKSEKGADKLQQKIAGLKAAFSVLGGELINAGDKMAEAFDKPEKKAKSFWTMILGSFNPAFLETGVRMDMASQAAENYTKELQRLEDQERAMIVPRAEANLKIKEARMLYDDETKSIDVRMAALANALQLENETADAEVKHQQQVIAQLRLVNQEKLNAGQLRDADETKLQQAIAREIELRTESVGRQLRINKTLQKAREDLSKDEVERVKKEVEDTLKLRLLQAKGDPEKMKEALKENYEQQIAAEKLTNTQRLILKAEYEDAVAEIDKDAKAKELARIDKQNDAKEKKEKEANEKRKADTEAGFEYQRIKAEGDLDTLNTILDAEYGALLASADYEKMTQNQKLLAEQQYTKAKQELSQARINQVNQEKKMVANALGAMSDLVGRETAMGKVFAIAEATINTWVAASQALADKTIPSTVARVALMASIIATGLANVRNILAVDTGGGSGGGSSTSSSVTSAPAIRHVTAPAVGASAITPSQAPAAISAANGSMLTADGIAAALAAMPPPVVTVEDINARTQQKRKVDVAANV